jgi:hypothetical protein
LIHLLQLPEAIVGFRWRETSRPGIVYTIPPAPEIQNRTWIAMRGEFGSGNQSLEDAVKLETWQKLPPMAG